jgi:hypothetical protein
MTIGTWLKTGASKTLVSLMTRGINLGLTLWIKYSIKIEKQNPFGIFDTKNMLYGLS